MSERGMRVTVEDLGTGEKQERVIPPGEYVLVTTNPCWLAGRSPTGTAPSCSR